MRIDWEKISAERLADLKRRHERGEAVAAKEADHMERMAHQWGHSYNDLFHCQAEEPENGWWSPDNPTGARWWVPSDFVPGWGEQRRAA